MMNKLHILLEMDVMNTFSREKHLSEEKQNSLNSF